MASTKSTDTATGKKAAQDGAAKAPAKASAQKATKAKKQGKNSKPGLIARLKQYLADVKTEIHRVVWPTREEMVKYTCAVIGMLLFFGILIAIVDAAVIPALYAFSGLRG